MCVCEWKGLHWPEALGVSGMKITDSYVLPDMGAGTELRASELRTHFLTTKSSLQPYGKIFLRFMFKSSEF